MDKKNDILIIGGGLVGASLACALENLGLRITIVESTPFDSQAQPSFDERTIAITWSSRQIFEAIGVWQEIVSTAHPINRIHVSEKGHPGLTQLDCSLINVEALGYVIPTRSIGKALFDRLKQSYSVQILTPANAKDVHATVDSVVVNCDTVTNPLSASLLVLADGGRSPISSIIGATRNEKKYHENIMITRIDSNKNHDGMAFERFSEHGPIALLPIGDTSFSVAWTLPKERSEAYMGFSDGELLLSLQKQFGFRAGEFTSIGTRKIYPLARTYVKPPSTHRTVLIGNAAHEVHPVAGQGFNLGLSDVAELAELIANATQNKTDIGHYSIIDSYIKNRANQTKRVIAFTDGLINMFDFSFPGAGLFRSIGLTTIDMMPSIKRALLLRTTGLSGEKNRLLRGIPLALNQDLT
tara:strand:+ start:194 stop:1429 length:1236 start_codon:yes stop_codon:yes gene_type:complete